MEHNLRQAIVGIACVLYVCMCRKRDMYKNLGIGENSIPLGVHLVKKRKENAARKNEDILRLSVCLSVWSGRAGARALVDLIKINLFGRFL